MESLPKDAILEYNEDILQEVRKIFGFDNQEAMKNAVDILEEWIKMQQHFTKKDFDKKYLEMTIITSKGSIERAKSRIDKACTLRTLMPDLFQIHNLKLLFDTDLKDVKLAGMPRLTKNHERVFILKGNGQKFESTFMKSISHACHKSAEYLRRNDYAVSWMIFFDFTELNLTELLKVFTVNSVQETKALVFDCCGFRLKAAYVMSSSKLVEIVVAILKQVFSQKLVERISVIKDKDELKNIIDVDVFPKEYGGKEKSLHDIHNQWIDVLTSEDHIEYSMDMNAARTNEDLRQVDTFNEQYMGMPGTFRTFTVD